MIKKKVAFLVLVLAVLVTGAVALRPASASPKTCPKGYRAIQCP